tara:strand:+ start:275 stop:556 length:282 start_codon:yes stop_codon:yes gene_type:complete
MSVLRFKGAMSSAANAAGSKSTFDGATIVYAYSTAEDKLVTIHTNATNDTAGNVVIASFTMGKGQMVVFAKEATQAVFAPDAVHMTAVDGVGG